MSDGSVIIDTELDQSGLKTGLASMGKTAVAGFATVVAALGTVTAAAVNAGIEFESAFAGVKKTVDATEAELGEFRSGILQMSTEIPITTTEIAGIAEAAGQLGIQNENLLGFTRTMADLGVATNLTSEEAATALARLANITGMSQSEFSNLGSTIVALGNNLATTESEIVNMALRLAGTGAQVGMTEDQILSLAAAASSVGLEAEAGGSAFSRVMSMMQLAAEEGGEALNALANVAGMTSDEFKTAFKQDAAGALIAFVDGLGAAEESGKSAIGVISELGEISELSALDTIAVRDALLRASGASDVFTNALEIGSEAWKNNTALANEASQRYETMESKIQILKNSLVALGTAAYEDLREPLSSAVTMGIDMVNQLSTALSEGGLAALASSIGDILAQVVSKFGEYIPIFVQSAVDLIESFVGGLVQSTPAISGAAADLCAILFDGLAAILPDLLSLGIELLLGFAKGLTSNISSLAASVTEIIATIVTTLLESLPEILNCGIEVLSALIQAIPTVAATLASHMPEIIVAVVTALLECIPQLAQAGYNLFVSLKNNLGDAITTLVSAAPQIVSALISKFGSMTSDFFNAGKNMILGIRDGVASAASSLVTAAVNAAKNALNSVKSFLGINSPSRRARDEIGEQILPGIEQGINQTSPELNKVMESAASDMLNSFDAIAEDFDVSSLVARMKRGVEEQVEQIGREVSVRTSPVLGLNEGPLSETLDYDRLADAIVRAFIHADVKVACDDRELGRLISDLDPT